MIKVFISILFVSLLSEGVSAQGLKSGYYENGLSVTYNQVQKSISVILKLTEDQTMNIAV